MNFINPEFSVRFYIRPEDTKQVNAPTSLRVKVWLSEDKRRLFLTTAIKITPEQWKYFVSNGNPRAGADPKLIKEVGLYKVAIRFVISSAFAAGIINDLKSADFITATNEVIAQIRLNEKHDRPRQIGIFLSPKDVVTCVGCNWCGEKCNAPWKFEDSRLIAADRAYSNKQCPMRQIDCGNFVNIYQSNADAMPCSEANEYQKAFGNCPDFAIVPTGYVSLGNNIIKKKGGNNE